MILFRINMGFGFFFFQGVMVRLMLVLAPVMCVLSGIGISSVLTTYMRQLDVNQLKKGVSGSTPSSTRSRRGDDSSSYPHKNEIAFGVVCMMTFFLMTYVFHCTWVTSEAYSSPSIVLSARGGDGSKYIFDDFREAYWWLRYNTHEVKMDSDRTKKCFVFSRMQK